MKQDVAETIHLLSRALAHDFRLLPLEFPDSPVFLAVAMPTRDGATGLKPRLPAGRGLTPQHAMIAAGAEAVELRASLAPHHLPRILELPRGDGLAMVAALDLVTGDTVPVPAQSVFLDCAATLGEPLTTDANSTGCAAAATRNAASMAALWECVERDAVALWWHGGVPAGALPLDLIDRQHPRLFWWLEQRQRKTRLLDLTTDIGLPVVAAVSATSDGRCVAVGTAARPDLAAAALAAVTEMVQTEVGMDQARDARDPQLLLWDAQASTESQPQFQPRGTRRHPASTLDPKDLARRLQGLGHPVLAVDMTLANDPLPSMRVLVPGLCAMGGRIDTPRFQAHALGGPGLTLPEPY